MADSPALEELARLLDPNSHLSAAVVVATVEVGSAHAHIWQPDDPEPDWLLRLEPEQLRALAVQLVAAIDFPDAWPRSVCLVGQELLERIVRSERNGLPLYTLIGRLMPGASLIEQVGEGPGRAIAALGLGCNARYGEAVRQLLVAYALQCYVDARAPEVGP